MIGGGFIHARAAARTRRLAAFSSLARWAVKRTSAKRRKMRPRTGCEYSAAVEAGVGAELVSGVPEAFFERVGGGVFFRWSDPVHGSGTRVNV